MMEAVRTSETSVNIYLTTQQYIIKDCKLHSRRRENLKSHNSKGSDDGVEHLKESCFWTLFIVYVS
jgi:hypothetical protein